MLMWCLIEKFGCVGVGTTYKGDGMGECERGLKIFNSANMCHKYIIAKFRCCLKAAVRETMPIQ